MGLLDALTAVVIKKLALTERLVTMLLYLGLVTTAASIMPAYLVWVQPSAWDLVLLVLITLVTTVSQVFGIFAWRVAEATAIAPFNYTQLLFAGLAGFVIFAEVPDRWTVAGAAVIVASTFYIGRREARLKGSAADAPIAADLSRRDPRRP